MNPTRSVRWAIPLGSALLSLSIGCAGLGHPGVDAAADRLLAPAVVSAQPLPPAGGAATVTEMAADPGVRTIALQSGEDKSTAKPAEELLPPPKTDPRPEPSPPPGAAAGYGVVCR